MVLRDGPARPRPRARALTRGGGLTSRAARGWLEALGLERRLPDARFFEDLFLRFQRRVACETLTRSAGDPAAFDAEAFAAEWPVEERGLAGEERACAFAWLARELGFEVMLEESLCSRPWARAERDELRPGLGDGGLSSKVNGEDAHRSVVATIEGCCILADAGFPIPVLVPLQFPSKEIPSSFGTLSVASAGAKGDGGGFRVTCEARGEISDLLRLGPAPDPNPLPLEEISRTPPTAPPLVGAGGRRAVFALRVLDDRVLHWAAGRVTILDAWSVLTYPLAGTERAAFESLFALNLEGVELPDAPAAEEPAMLAVFHFLAVPPEAARRALAPVGEPPELVTSRTIDVVPRSGGSRLSSRALLAGAMPPGGPGESVRRTLVFHLAMELLGAGSGPGG